MLSMTQKNDIRKRYYEQGQTISEISRETGHDRKTVRQYIEQTDWSQPLRNKSAAGRPTKIDAYKPIIDSWLEEDKKARKKQRHTGQRVFDRLKEQFGEEFDCCYKTVCSYVTERKKQIYSNDDCYLQLDHIRGEAQADFGEADFRENGKLYHGYSLNLSFPHSNQGYLQVFKGQNQECFFEGLINIFEHIGGTPHRIWFDNASTLVSKVFKNGNRNLTDEFMRFQEHYGFRAAFCNPASGHEKGSVESKVGYHRRNMLVPVPEFRSLTDYNASLLTRCDEDGQREHYRKEGTIWALHREDREALLKLPHRKFEPAKYLTVRVNSYGSFTLNNGLHKYSTEPKCSGKHITVKLTANEVIVLDESMREIVIHERLYGNEKQKSMQWLPYLSQLARKPAALKYTGIYSMLPDALKDYIERCDKTDRGKVLQVIRKITDESSFENAVNTVAEALKYEAADPDSLLMVHTRFNAPKLKLVPVKVPATIPELSKVEPGITAYDFLLSKAGERQC